MKKIVLFICFCAVFSFVKAQSLDFVLPLDGGIGDLSVPANAVKAADAGWILNNTSTLKEHNLAFIEPDVPLFYTDAEGTEYPEDGINTIYSEHPYYVGTGTTATSTGNVSGVAAAYPFSSDVINSGKVYMTFMFQSFCEVASGQRSPGSSVQMIGLTAGANSGAGVRLWMRKNTEDDPDGHTSYKLTITRAAGNTTSGISATATTDMTFSFSTTYLLVMKYDFDTETASLFVNPVIGSKTEPNPAATDNGSKNSDGTLSGTLQYIQVRLNGNNLAYYYIGGVRVTDTWEDAVAGDVENGINNVKASSVLLTGNNKTIQTSIPGTITVYSPMGTKVLQSAIESTIDTNLQTGVYFVRLITDSGQIVNQKIMIK